MRIHASIRDHGDLKKTVAAIEHTPVLDNIDAAHQGTVGHALANGIGFYASTAQDNKNVAGHVDKLRRITGEFGRTKHESGAIPLCNAADSRVVRRHDHLGKQPAV